jgi:hypothetical protein
MIMHKIFFLQPCPFQGLHQVEYFIVLLSLCFIRADSASLSTVEESRRIRRKVRAKSLL